MTESRLRQPCELGVNVDHVATVREARQTTEPDPVYAALEAERGGADHIVVHLREDRRHIQERDLKLLLETVQTGVNLELERDCTGSISGSCNVRSGAPGRSNYRRRT